MTGTILAIDTSCDETAAAVTEGNRVLSNIVWSQASLHAQWGGVVPSLAKRAHQERISWVVSRALRHAKVDAIAVTVGPGLAPALEVGIAKAKELALGRGVPLIPVNHLEGHVLSSLARMNSTDLSNLPNLTNFLALVVSGGHTELVLAEKAGTYTILARTIDDALGEALDKAARMLGLGYPGGAVLEKLAKEGNPQKYKLPIPLLGKENQGHFSFSGLKTAFYRLVQSLESGKRIRTIPIFLEEKNRRSARTPHSRSCDAWTQPTGESKRSAGLNRQEICDLAASFQNTAFEHLIRIIAKSIVIPALSRNLYKTQFKGFLIGGGVAANLELRRRLRKLGKQFSLTIHFPYSKKLCTDNAAMIGLAAQWAWARGEAKRTPQDIASVDRLPNLNFS